jgi:hypothetical protein
MDKEKYLKYKNKYLELKKKIINMGDLIQIFLMKKI